MLVAENETLLKKLGIQKIDSIDVKQIDFEKSAEYEGEFLFTRTGELIINDPYNKKIYEIKHKEQIEQILLIDKEQFEKLKSHVFDYISGKMELETGDTSADDDTEELDDTSVAKIIERILLVALKEGASDIHILPKKEETKVLFRVDGVLKEFKTYPKGYAEYLINKIKTLSRLDIAQKLKPQDGKMKLFLKNEQVEVEFRVSTLPTIYGEDCVLRVQQTEEIFKLALEDLGFEPDDLEKYRQTFTKPSGLILNVGATGQGKTTTFYLTIKELVEKFDGKKNIITVEDPVEIRFDKITQIEVDDRQGRTFPVVLRSLLRQDPDIILIGEIRDEETAEIGVRASITGHLVLATLHAEDTFNAITRLRDLGLSNQLIASTLNSILSQRLIRKLCDNCKEKIKTPSALSEEISAPYIYTAKGCEKCGYTGYKGRTAVIEVLVLDEDIKTAISEGSSEVALKKLAREKGFSNLWKNALKKVERGETSYEEIKSLVKKDVILNETQDRTVIDVGQVFYPHRKIPVHIKGKQGYLFDISKRGISFIFQDVYLLEINKPLSVKVEGKDISFTPKSYKKTAGGFIVGGVYKGDLTNLIEE